jgi:hypothetical protein
LHAVLSEGWILGDAPAELGFMLKTARRVEAPKSNSNNTKDKRIAPARNGPANFARLGECHHGF